MSVEINVTNEIVEINEVSELVEINVTGGIGPAGPAGQGVPVGGLTGQVLAKNSSTNYDTIWTNAATGTVTSVNMSVPTGLTISGNPITSSGTLALGLASGYSIPTTASQATWTTAYNDSIVSAAVTGTTTKTLTLTQQDAGTITASWTDINTDAVTSVFGRTGAVIAAEGDYTLTQLGDVTITSPLTNQVLKYNGTTWVNNTDTDTGLTSVALTMPSAFNVANSPLTSNGTLAVTSAGLATQYIRGDGQLATFPSTASGGSSVNYYLNGSVASSVAGYQQMDNNAIVGGGTDFTLVGNGLIAQFLTDAGNPNRIQIPGGAWNFEMFFQVSSSGGSQKFYLELHKYDGSNFTLIASSSLVPEEITGGTAIDLYLTSLAVPTTTLLTTDRLAIRVYIVDNAVGRTITLHTENTTLCEIITTFAGGVSSLNGLSANTQYFATGTSGMDFNINSVSDTHTFNLPTASATNRGALSSANWTTFNNKQDALTLTTSGASGSSTLIGATLNVPTYTLSGLGGQAQLSGTGFVKISGTTISYDNSTYQPLLTNPVTGTGTTNYLTKFTGASAIGDSLVYDNGTNVLVGTTTDGTIGKLQVVGSGGLMVNEDGAGTKVIQIRSNFAGVDPAINVSTNNALLLQTNNTERARITSSGNLLVGTTTDNGSRLQVTGAATFSSTIAAAGYGSANSIMTQPVASFYGTNGWNLGSDGTNALIGVINSGTDMIFLKRVAGVYSEALRIASTGAATFSSDVTISGVLQETITTNRQTASYTLALTDRGKLVEMNVATANTLTIPLNSSIAFPIGTKIDITQYGAGQVTITATGGVTLRSFTSYIKLAGQYAACTLVKIGTNEWYAYGNLVA